MHAGERAVGVHDERAAVEDQFVLAADLVDVGERHPRFGHACARELETVFELVHLERRAVGDEQHLAPRVGQMRR